MLDADLIRMRVDVLRLSMNQLAAISKIPAPKLSLFLNGTRGITALEVTKLRGTLDDLEQLVHAANPFPVDFRNAEIIRDLISKMKSGEFDDNRCTCRSVAAGQHAST